MRSIQRLFLFFLMLGVFVVLSLFSSTVQAECDPTESNPILCLGQVGNESGFGNRSVMQIAVDILNAALSFVVIIVFGFLIYGGYFWMLSGGNEEKIRKAKQILTASIIGLIIILASLSIVTLISEVLGINPPEAPEGSNLSNLSLSQIAVNVVNVFLGFTTVVALAAIIWSGFRWMTSGGNEKTLEEAKRTLTASVAGLVIILISWVIIRFVADILGANIG